MKFLIVSLGFLLSKTPEFVLRGLCCFVAWVISTFMSSRMRVAYSNLSHCFPELSEAEIKKIGKESVRRMVEMGLFVVASPYISIEKLKQRIKVDPNVIDKLSEVVKNPRPVVIAIPHFCMMESITLMPALIDKKLPPIGVYYRPFKNNAIEDWVKSTRERCGINLLSRRDSMRKSIDFLKANGCIAMLFDQNAHSGSTYGLFFDRLCKTTEFPRILADYFHCDIAVLFAKRTGFWRSEISGDWLEIKNDDIAFSLNSWLQKKLTEDSQVRMDWLWLHRRWSRMLLSLPKFKEEEAKNIELQSGGKIKRLSRIAITAPASLRGTLALIPLIKTLRESRADSTISLIVEKRFFEEISSFDFVDEVLCAPNYTEKFERLRYYTCLRKRYFDIHITFADSNLADLENAVIDAIISLGIQTPVRKRRFIEHKYLADYASETESLLSYYEKFFRFFKMVGDVDLTPLKTPKKQERNFVKVAIICGGKGNHALSPQKWGEIIKKLDTKIDEVKFVVFGDEQDSRTAFEITSTAEYADIVSFAGKLNNEQLMSEISDSDIAIGTDCRLTHLANALGVKVVAVYGQTNPVRNGLVFDAPKAIVRPRNSPAQGGVPVEMVDTSDVFSEALKLIKE